MTLTSSRPHAKRRWLALVIVVTALSALAVSSALAVITTIPSNFFTVVDQQGANDQPGQVDLTQMGRDDTDATKYKLFWSWDSISAWTGTGQTGDACALFDKNSDTKIDFVVCARVANVNADPTNVQLVPWDSSHPVFLFNCSNAKNDRCTQPSAPLSYSSPTQVDAGVLGSLTKANLITETDPFPAGESYKSDSTVEVDILKSVLPSGSVLVNVCSYPSAGNGGNNNPFDCIVSPGGGFLTIVKDAGSGVTSPTFGFSVNTSPTATTRSIDGSGTAAPIGLAVGTSTAVTETTIPSPWSLITASCVKADGTTSTGTLDLVNKKVTGIAIESGKITTCTFQDRIPNGTLVVKKVVVNDNGGTKHATDFTFSVNGGTATAFTQDPDNDVLHGRNSLTVQVGTTYNVTEPTVTGYDTTYSGCSDVTVTAGGTATCTITNNDRAGTLIVKKVVVNDNGGTKHATDFTFSVDGAAAVSFLQDADNNVLHGSNTLTVNAGSHSVTEPAVTGYDTTYSNCSNVSIANDATATCTITNNDTKASPGIGTTMTWTLNDAEALTGFRTGGTSGTATFSLYKDNGALTCESGTLVYGPVVVDVDSTGAAATTGGYTTSNAGTYRWKVVFSGDTFNSGVTSNCAEITTLP
jgi:hypothetical protein